MSAEAGRPPAAGAASLLDQLREIVETNLPLASGDARARLVDAAVDLRQPLRVAIVGRAKAGKSTLVNALLGQRVAPTDVSECTQVVAWFRHGFPERIDVNLHDDRRLEIPLTPDGMLPPTLGVDPANVRSLHVWLANERLEGMTLIDTPGLGSLSADISAATERLLDGAYASTDGALSADAVAFVINGPLKEDELAAIQRLRSSRLAASAANSIGVLTRIDQIAGRESSVAVARELAAKLAERHRADLAAVVPVVGLLAETSLTGHLTERDAAHLAQIAALDEPTTTRMLRFEKVFLATECEVPREARRSLWERLDRVGLERCVEVLRSGRRGAGPLQADLAAFSGIEAVEQSFAGSFAGRFEVLKARRIRESLQAVAWADSPPADRALRTGLRDQLEALDASPAGHAIAEMHAFHRWCTGLVSLPDDLVEDLRRVAQGRELTDRLAMAGAGSAALRTAALAGHRRWSTFRNRVSTRPEQKDIAMVVMTSYHHMLASIEHSKERVP